MISSPIDVPASKLSIESSNAGENASLLGRLLAALIDGLVISVCVAPIAWLLSGIITGTATAFIYSALIAISAIVIFAFLNGKLLVTQGQTLGKKLMGIKIVTTAGTPPLVKPHLLKRYACYLLAGQVPVIGPLFSLINILFVFAPERRCVHDLFADTRVVVS